MECKQFKEGLASKRPPLYGYDVNDNLEYSKWFNHARNECSACRDLFMKAVLKWHKIPVTQYPCIHIAYHVNHGDRTIDKIGDSYVVPCKDGETCTVISNCPWCGKQLG